MDILSLGFALKPTVGTTKDHPFTNIGLIWRRFRSGFLAVEYFRWWLAIVAILR